MRQSDLDTHYYWDTSALFPLLFQEPQTRVVRALVQKKTALPGFTSFFSFLEIESILARRIAEGSLSGDVAQIRIDIGILTEALAILWPERGTLNIGKRCVLEYRLKPADALQLASALELQGENHNIIFVGLDERLNRAARAAKLQTVF